MKNHETTLKKQTNHETTLKNHGTKDSPILIIKNTYGPVSPADLCKNCARQRRNTKFGINIL